MGGGRDTIRRGERPGWNRTTPGEADHCQPKITSRDEIEREMIERREREERGERGETHRALCREYGQVGGRDPDRADLRPLTII